MLYLQMKTRGRQKTLPTTLSWGTMGLIGSRRKRIRSVFFKSVDPGKLTTMDVFVSKNIWETQTELDGCQKIMGRCKIERIRKRSGVGMSWEKNENDKNTAWHFLLIMFSEKTSSLSYLIFLNIFENILLNYECQWTKTSCLSSYNAGWVRMTV